ncbi:MAG: hypothetical protein WCD81_12305 [Candidatus Bathyarchaeia archaeon]
MECKADLTLLSILGVPTERIEHAGNKSGVVRKLIRGVRHTNYENSVGMVDEDPRSLQLPDLKKFQATEIDEAHKIRLLQYRWLNNHLLILCPRLEEWIVEASREAGTSPSLYDLPDNPVALHELINLNVRNFERLLGDITEASDRIRNLRDRLKTFGLLESY